MGLLYNDTKVKLPNPTLSREIPTIEDIAITKSYL